MKDNFDLKQFLLENNLTAGSRQLKEEVSEDVWNRLETAIANDDEKALKAIALELLGKAGDWAKEKVSQGADWMKQKLTKAYDISDDEVNEAFNPKSKLEEVIAQAWAEKDLEKAKQIIRDLIEPSRVKAKDDILRNMEPIQSKAKFDYYLANSLLKFEGLGLSEAAPASMQAGFDMVSQQKREHADMMRIANKLFPQHGGNLVNFKPLSREERDQVYAKYAEELRGGVKEGIHDIDILSRPMSNPAIEPLEQSPEELSKAADARSENILRAKYNRQIQDPNISDEELKFMLTGKGVKGFGGTPNAVNNILASRSTIEEFSPYGSIAFSGEKRKENEKAPLSSLEVGDLVYAQGVSGDNIVVKDKKEDGTVGIGHPHSDRVSYHNGDKEVQVVKRANVKENKMTQRDKYLTRLVENALGLDPDNMEEAEDIVQVKPLPEYNTIEELMKEIEEGTGKTAMEYRMKRTKELYEALEEQLKSLEEGEHSKHIDKKHTKKMRSESAQLRKYEAKLMKEYERKYDKKPTKKAAPKKEEVPMEEIAINESKSFDLRKFLIENKLTTSSRLLNESNFENVLDQMGYYEDDLGRKVVEDSIEHESDIEKQLKSIGAHFTKEYDRDIHGNKIVSFTVESPDSNQ